MLRVGSYLVDVYAEAEALQAPPWVVIGCPETAGHPAWMVWRQDRKYTLEYAQKVAAHRAQEERALKQATGQR